MLVYLVFLWVEAVRFALRVDLSEDCESPCKVFEKDLLRFHQIGLTVALVLLWEEWRCDPVTDWVKLNLQLYRSLDSLRLDAYMPQCAVVAKYCKVSNFSQAPCVFMQHIASSLNKPLDVGDRYRKKHCLKLKKIMTNRSKWLFFLG